MFYLIDEKLFGNVETYTRVVESQKRNFPPAYCIFSLYQPSKQLLKRSENVEHLVDTEIPSAQDQDLVLKHSINAPCGCFNNPSAVP